MIGPSTRHHTSRAVEDNGHRLIGDVELLPHFRGMAEGIRHIELLCVGLAVGDGVVVRNADERHLPPEVLSQLVEVRLLRLADRSPRLP